MPLCRLTRTLVIGASLLRLIPAHAADPLDLGSHRGRVVYLDFWASWCMPCRQSFPWMEALEHSYRQQGLEIIAVNVDHDHADAERFLKSFTTSFQLLFDPEGSLAERFKIAGMPTSVLIDRHGVARFTHLGFRAQDRESYEQQIRALLAEH